MRPITSPAIAAPNPALVNANLIRAEGAAIRWAGIVAVGAYTWSGQIKQIPPFSRLPIDLTLLAAGLSAGAALLLVVRLRSIRLRGRWVAVLVSLLVIGLSGSVNRSSTSYGSLKELNIFLITLPMGLVIAVLVKKRAEFVAFVLASTMWAGFSSVSVLVGGIEDVSGRLSATTGATISFSRAAGMVVIVALAWGLTERQRSFVRLFPFVLMVSLLELYIVVRIGARGPAQAVLIAVIAMVVVQWPRLRLQVGIRVFAVLVLCVIGGSFLWTRSPEFARRRILGIVTGEFGGREGGGRLSFYSWTAENLPNSPFGYGWGSWPIRSGFPGYRHVHNIFLELWFEAGLIGLSLFVCLLVWVSRDQLKRVELDPFVATVSIGLVYLWLGSALVSGDINDNRSLFVFLCAIAATELTSRQKEKGGRSEPVSDRIEQ